MLNKIMGDFTNCTSILSLRWQFIGQWFWQMRSDIAILLAAGNLWREDGEKSAEHRIW